MPLPADLLSYLMERYQPHALILHGSRAREEAVESSDYDIHIVTDDPASVEVHSYNGYQLDLTGKLRDGNILSWDKTPIWPLELIYDDGLKLGHAIIERTRAKFEAGPELLSSNEIDNRRNYVLRVLNRLEQRGDDFLIRMYYVGDLADRYVRYYFELNNQWTKSQHRMLQQLPDVAPELYGHLKGLYGEDYLVHARYSYKFLFDNPISPS